MDKVYSLPLERLRAAVGANGLQYELQSKSWDKFQRFLREGEDHLALVGADRPYMIHSSVQENHPGVIFDRNKLAPYQCATGEANS